MLEPYSPDQTNSLSLLFAECWKNPDLRESFVNDPKVLFEEHGVDGLSIYADMWFTMLIDIVHLSIAEQETPSDAPQAVLDISDDKLCATGKVLARCCQDDSFNADFHNNPIGRLAETGVRGMELWSPTFIVSALEITEGCLRILKSNLQNNSFT